MSDPLSLTTAIGSYPHTAAIKDGRVTSKRLVLTLQDITPIPRAFKPMANDLAFDVSEMAIVTYLIAKQFDKPFLLLPVVLAAQPELPLLVCTTGSPLHTAADVAGKTIGIRSYSQTTATWVRGILRDVAAVEPGSIRWRTIDPSHLDGYEDPPTVSRMPAGSDLFAALEAGEIDAAIIAWEARGRAGIRPLVDDAFAIEADWMRRRDITPVNHFLSVRSAVLRDHPWVAGELVEMFRAARAAAGDSFPTNVPHPGPWGIEANRPAIEAMTEFAHRQGITPRRYRLEELFAL